MTLRTLLIASSVAALTAGTFAYAQTVNPDTSTVTLTDPATGELHLANADRDNDRRRGGRDRHDKDCDKEDDDDAEGEDTMPEDNDPQG